MTISVGISVPVMACSTAERTVTIRRYSSIDMPGFKSLCEGDRVSFEVEDTDRGPKAKEVKKL